MSGAERVLAGVGEKAEPLMPVDEWRIEGQVVDEVQRVRTWGGGFTRKGTERANLRRVLVGLAALCVAAVVALDEKKEG